MVCEGFSGAGDLDRDAISGIPADIVITKVWARNICEDSRQQATKKARTTSGLELGERFGLNVQAAGQEQAEQQADSQVVASSLSYFRFTRC